MIHCSVLLSKQNLSRCNLKVNIYYRLNHHEIFDQVRKKSQKLLTVFFKRDTDIQKSLLDSVGEGEGGMIWENGIETCTISYKK